MPSPACNSAASAAIWARRSVKVTTGGGDSAPSVMNTVLAAPAARVWPAAPPTSRAGSQARLSVSTL